MLTITDDSVIKVRKERELQIISHDRVTYPSLIKSTILYTKTSVNVFFITLDADETLVTMNTCVLVLLVYSVVFLLKLEYSRMML